MSMEVHQKSHTEGGGNSVVNKTGGGVVSLAPPPSVTSMAPSMVGSVGLQGRGFRPA